LITAPAREPFESFAAIVRKQKGRVSTRLDRYYPIIETTELGFDVELNTKLK
jgi:hypothetical protein